MNAADNPGETMTMGQTTIFETFYFVIQDRLDTHVLNVPCMHVL